jgi:hypothetical protein
MGQQQLLFMVLGIIIVGIAVGFANRLLDTSVEDSNKDSIASELLHIGMLAPQYYNKPIEMGGGSKSYISWQIPSELDSTTSGTYIIENRNLDELILSGIPFVEKEYSWYLRTTVTKEDIVTEIVL